MGFLSGIAGAVEGSALGPVGTLAGGISGGSSDQGLGWTPWSHAGGDWSPTGTPPAPPSYVGPNAGDNGYSAPQGPTQVTSAPVDQGGLDAYRQAAMDPSAWTAPQLAESAHQTQVARDQANTQGASNSARAADQIAMSGGLRSGAAERVAEQGGIGSTLAGQQAGQAGQARDLAIQTAGHQAQLGALGNLANVENQYHAPGQAAAEFNVNAAQTAANAKNNYGLAASGAQNAYNAQNYQTNAGIYGANQLAGAEAYNRNNQSLWDKIT